MFANPSDPTLENKRLQRSLNALISVFALSASDGRKPIEVLAGCIDSVLETLELDFAYVQARVGLQDKPIEVLRVNPSGTARRNQDELGQVLRRWLSEDERNSPAQVQFPIGGQETSIFRAQIGVEGDLGLIVAGSIRIGFPGETERLVLGVAANQLAIALQQAPSLEQMPAATEADRQFAERARELAKTNEDLGLQDGLLQHLPVSAWTLSADGTPDFVNQVWLDYSGQTLDFVRANPEAWLTVVHPDDRERASRAFRNGVLSGEGFAIETRSRRAQDGSYRWHLQQAVVLRDAGGNVLKFIGTTTDIDDQKRTEERLRESEKELRLIVDSIPGLIALMSPTGVFDVANRQLLEYFGQTLEELKQWGTNDTIHPEDLPRVIDVFARSIATGDAYEITQRYKRWDGIYRWFQNRGFPIRDADGNIARWCVLLTDIDDQRRAEEALRESERDLSLIIDTIPTLSWCNRTDGTNDFLSKSWHEYTGLSPAEAHGWGWQAAFHPEDLPPLMKRWQEMLISGNSGEIEARLRRYDGVYRWFLIRAAPFRDATGNIVRWYGTSTDIDDRKRGEEALRESEQSLRLLLDGIAGLVAIMSATGETEVVNRQALEYFGRTTEQLKGWSTGDAVHPDDLPNVYSTWTRSVETGLVYDIDHRLRRADGVYRWFHARGLPLCDSEGRVLRWYVLLTDIHDRKQAEETLQNNERNLISIINTIPTAAWSARPDGHCDFLNQRWLDYAGMTAEQGQGWGWQAVIHPDDAPKIMEYWQSCLASGDPVDTEARIRRFDGTYRWFLFRANPLRDASGEIVKWYGTNFDIDDRKRAEDRVRRSEAYLEEAQHLTRIGSFSWRVEANQITWSEQLYRIYGITPGVPLTLDLIGARVHPDDIRIIDGVAENARNAVSDFEFEYRLLMPDRTVRYLHSIAHATRDQKGQLEYIGAVQDVTQRRLAEEALTEARSELAHVVKITSLGVMTASIAHEVNQPLSGIITNASTCLRMLNANPPNLDGARETARRTIRDGNRASDVITRLRKLYSKKEPSLEPMDLNEAAREVIALLLSELQKNGAILQLEFADNLPSVAGDRIQLQQVILNLVRNASDAMRDIEDRPRRLLIRTEQVDETVCVTVQDSGIGFDPGTADRLFESFYTTKPEGMGIGLSVSRSIIEAHHGRLWATANNGPGARFEFSIPCQHSAQSDREQAPTQKP